MVAILTVAGIVSALTAMRFAIRGREVEVPQLAGKTKDEAEALIKNNGTAAESFQFSIQF